MTRIKQQTFASAARNREGKTTRRERFLAELDAVIPCSLMVDLIEPYCSSSAKGRPPCELERRLRIYFLQQWFNLSDPHAEAAIYESESMRRFTRVALGEDKIPDESTILRRWQEPVAHSVGFGQSEHRRSQRQVLLDASVARLGEAPELLDDPKRVLAARPCPGAKPVALAPTRAQFPLASGSASTCGRRRCQRRGEADAW